MECSGRRKLLNSSQPGSWGDGGRGGEEDKGVGNKGSLGTRGAFQRPTL